MNFVVEEGIGKKSQVASVKKSRNYMGGNLATLQLCEKENTGSVINDSVIQFDREEFRTNFAGRSIGVEQELNEYKVWLDAGGERCIAEVRKCPSKEILLLITADLGVGNLYTIELVTSPTEQDPGDSQKAGMASIDDRKQALEFAVGQIQRAGDTDPGLLVSHEENGLQLLVKNTKHVIEKTKTAGSTVTAGNQVTVGVLLEEIDITLARNSGRWYQPGRYQNASLVDERERQIYNYVMCCVEFISGKTDLASAEAKNAWGVLPRTNPWTMAEKIFEQDKEALARVRAAISNAIIPNIDPGKLILAKRMIFNKDKFAHSSFESTIADKPAFIFEIRNPGLQEWGRYLYPFHELVREEDREPNETTKTVRKSMMSELNARFAQKK